MSIIFSINSLTHHNLTIIPAITPAITPVVSLVKVTKELLAPHLKG